MIMAAEIDFAVDAKLAQAEDQMTQSALSVLGVSEFSNGIARVRRTLVLCFGG